MDKNFVEVTGSLSNAQLISYLEDLIKSWKEGTVCIQQANDHVTLKPGENIEMEIEAGKKKGKEKIAIELTWTTEIPLTESSGLIISSSEPEPPSPAAVPTSAEEETAEKV